MVGTSGRPDQRAGPLTPNARSRPDLTCGSAGTMLLNPTCTSPPMSAMAAGELPLNGTCARSTRAMLLKSSMARCDADPTPDDE